ncbi:MAG: 2Fe-2S iron-sulfur cluster binding domain-containing protein [Holosporaceae bacterium]|jgi:2Fe-2S ferredoxin|nr:2Fe-2S iron-sulfur cluster binding domain-containing protein [Holosporaceae bacterium]
MKITFILKNGEEKTVQFTANQSVLKVAEKNHIPLASACEGFGACGKCHVLIENLQDKLSPISDLEEDTLDKVSGVTMNSRLACQLILNNYLDGLRIKLV